MSDVGWYAHSAGPLRPPERLAEHLAAVASRASGFADAFGAGDEARVAGLLHDIGKYGQLFQRRLEGREKGVDHWSPGAWLALNEYRENGIAIALSVQGHHVGLVRASPSELRGLEPSRLAAYRPRPRLSEQRTDDLLLRFAQDGLRLPTRLVSLYAGLGKETTRDPAASAMLDVRMLFSTLVDADFIETEAHFAGVGAEKRYRPAGPVLDGAWALERVIEHIADLAARSDSASAVKAVRRDLLDACLAAANWPGGVFTLSAPTGSGKTLAMLAFALAHAARHGLRRVVMVVPYLSIIDQTVQVYRTVFEPFLGPTVVRRYVLEDHSLAGTRSSRVTRDGQDDGSAEQGQERLLAENWDAPIVVTTSVQFLESLFANRPSACRKLHRLASSVILLDEVQTLPLHLAVPTLGTLSRLAERYRVSVVFSTATQPAFDALDQHVRNHARSGWRPREVVPVSLNLFSRARRVLVRWPAPGTTVSWTDLADAVVAGCAETRTEASLCIVNLKRHAVSLFRELADRGIEGLSLLSTALCPAHREHVLDAVRHRIREDLSCHLVATQCVEAGVDLDFPLVFRALAPLPAIAQAAGRCNRNGRRHAGTLEVFVPIDNALPDLAYRQATDVTRGMLDAGPLDVDNPETFREYYRRLYSMRDFDARDGREGGLRDAIDNQDFVETAARYRVIEQDAINVLVPYDDAEYDRLADLARKEGIDGAWIAAARPYVVSLFRPRPADPVLAWLEPARVRGGEYSDEWYIYLRREHYDRNIGLAPPSATECLIA